MSYHHGDLRQAVLQAAADRIASDGVAALNLRSLARDLGVAHTAPRHHFGDKRGVLTALATQGYLQMAERMTRPENAELIEAGVAYVSYAIEAPGHFAVMFRPDLVDESDPDLQAAAGALGAALLAAVDAFRGTSSSDTMPDADAKVDDGAAVDGVTDPRSQSGALAAWSLAHGLAHLMLAGVAFAPDGESTSDFIRRTLTHLAL